MKLRNVFSVLVLALTGMVSNNAFAVVVWNTDTCGSPDRIATMSDALHCAYGNGNPDGTTINGHYGDVWVDAGEVVASTPDGADGYLTATSNEGWGAIPNSGTWEIDASFWGLYDSAVITMHVGNGGGDPDHWAWFMNDGATSGTWSLDFLPDGLTGGGGLSNIRLWGVEGETSVPAPGAALLLGLGLIGLVGLRKKVS